MDQPFCKMSLFTFSAVFNWSQVGFVLYFIVHAGGPHFFDTWYQLSPTLGIYIAFCAKVSNILLMCMVPVERQTGLFVVHIPRKCTAFC